MARSNACIRSGWASRWHRCPRCKRADHHRPHPEKPSAARHLEGWAAARLVPTLRDASLRDAPQGEVVFRRSNGTRMSEIEWSRLKASQIKALAQRNAIVVVPIGATEQHGPHLPSM